jgi:hypothetical protein
LEVAMTASRRSCEVGERLEAELDAKAYERIFGAFERGEASAMSEADWEDLLAGRYRASGPSDGLALPARGRCRTLQTLSSSADFVGS